MILLILSHGGNDNWCVSETFIGDGLLELFSYIYPLRVFAAAAAAEGETCGFVL